MRASKPKAAEVHQHPEQVCEKPPLHEAHEHFKSAGEAYVISGASLTESDVERLRLSKTKKWDALTAAP